MTKIQLISFLGNDTCSRPKLSDLYMLFHSKLLENHTLHSGTYIYIPHMAVLPWDLKMGKTNLPRIT